MLNITAHGHLGRDPELREVGQTQLASFSLAACTGQDETTWINCSVWGKRADVVMRFLKKGSQVTVAGQGKVTTFQKKDGTEGKTLELKVSDFALPPREAAATTDEMPF